MISKKVNEAVLELESILESTNPTNQPQLPITRWRFCAEIDGLFSYTKTKMRSRYFVRSQLDARGMNSFLERCRTFTDSWPFENLHPVQLACRGWKKVAKNSIQCTEDLNKTIIVCKPEIKSENGTIIDKGTTLESLQAELAYRGCTFAIKTCPIEIYKNPINFYKTVGYKELLRSDVLRSDAEKTLSSSEDFLLAQFNQFELVLGGIDEKKLREKFSFFGESQDFIEPAVAYDYPRHINRYNLIGILKNYFKVENPTDKQIFFCLCLLYGWCCKIDTNANKTVLFCFLTGNVVSFVDSSKTGLNSNSNSHNWFSNSDSNSDSIQNFHPIKSHYLWSPWRETVRSQTFFDQLHGRKTSFTCDDDNDNNLKSPVRRKFLKRNSVTDCNNQEVQKFMQKLANIRRKKRRASQLEKSISLSPEEKAPVIKKSRSFDDIQEQIQECHSLCLNSLKSYTPQADMKRKLERKRQMVLKKLFGDGEKLEK